MSTAGAALALNRTCKPLGISQESCTARTTRLASPRSRAIKVNDHVLRGIGCSRKLARVITPSVPSAPVTSFGRSYPATFFTTLPPLEANVPSGSAIVTPIIRSRNAPYRIRNEPLSFAERIPPTVARSGHSGSMAMRWPCSASVFCRSWIVQPASTLTVKSAQAYSITRLSRAVERIRSARIGGLPQQVFVPPPRGTTHSPVASPPRSAAASSVSLPGSKTICGWTPATLSPGPAGCRCSAPTMDRRSSHGTAVTVSAPKTGGCAVISEAFCDSSGFQGMRSILPWRFTTQARARENLRRIGEVLWVKCATHALHRLEVGICIHLGHHTFLFFAHPVLARDGTSGLDAEFENAVGQELCRMFLPFDPAVIEDQWMQVAITGVKHVGHPDSRLGAESLDLVHDARQRRTRDHAVLHNVIRRNAADGGERRFTSFPHQGAFRLRLRHTDFLGAALPADLVYQTHQRFDFRRRPIELHQQQSATVRVVGMHSRFSGLDRQVIHHFNRCRQHACGDDIAHRSPGVAGGTKRCQQRLDAFGSLHDAENHLSGNAQGALGAHEYAWQVVAWRIERLAAQVH